MQTSLIGDFDTTTMLGVVRETKRVPSFLRDRFFGNNLLPVESMEVNLDFVRDNRALAPIVSRHQNGVLIEKNPIVTGKYRPPKLCPLGIFNGDEAFVRSPGEKPGGELSPEERAAAYAAQEILRHERLIARRWEWMVAQLLTTGSITLDGEGVTDTIDTGHDMTVTLSGSDLWDASTSRIRKNLSAWADDIAEESDFTPDTVILGRDAANALLDDESIQKLLDVRNFNVGSITRERTPNGARYLGNLEGLDLFVYPSWFRHDSTNASTMMIPANMAIIGCSAEISPDQKMVFGGHYEVEEQKAYYETIIPRVWVDKAKNTRFLECVSYPVPIIPNVGSWMRCIVTE